MPFFSRQFDPTRDLPDLAGKVALVSGSNSGIGYEVALRLALADAKVYVACRSEERGLAAIANMVKDYPDLKDKANLHYLKLDLSTVVGTKRAALSFMDLETRLDILVNNAGISNQSYTIGPEGVEAEFAVNHLGTYTLTTTLLPLLCQTALLPSTDVRIVTVSSGAHALVTTNPKFASLDDLNTHCAKSDDGKDTLVGRTRRYGMSKLANILFARQLQYELLASPTPGAKKILSISIHPGAVATAPFLALAAWLRFLAVLFLSTPLQGSATPLFAAVAPVVREKRELYEGKYLVPVGKLETPSELARNDELAKTLWRTSEEVVGDILRNGGM
ncbi:NAD-P-binding protein [Pseudohyphozyma bogoriensis]|nr:NAD-P-binding protein [Pseudohyphozyma bogoriensis]